jgi:HEAT repeat protein
VTVLLLALLVSMAVCPAPVDLAQLNPAVDDLFVALKEGGGQVHMNARLRLRRIYETEATLAERKLLEERFVDLLENGTPGEICAAITLLRGSGDDEVVRMVVKYLKSDHRGIRTSAIQWVLGNHEKSAVPDLVRLLKTENTGTKTMIVRALGSIKDKKATLAVADCLNDKDKLLRKRSAEALGKIGDARGALPLAKRLAVEKKLSVHSECIVALGKLRSKDGVPALLKALESELSYTRGLAARALGDIGDAAALPALCKATEDEGDGVRKFAAEALGRIGSKKAVPFLTKILKDPAAHVVDAALVALVKIGDKSAIGLIVKRGSHQGRIPSVGASTAYTDVQAWALWKLDPERYKQPTVKVVGHH